MCVRDGPHIALEVLAELVVRFTQKAVEHGRVTAVAKKQLGHRAVGEQHLE
jgi:hypothetical protein